MKVGSQLEDAQLEITDDAGESTTVGMIKYNNVQDSISVGDGTITKRVFPVEGDFGAFRSAMYPVGSMINSFLTDAQFIAEMDDKWVNVNTLELASAQYAGSHFKIAKSTALGAYLDSAGAIDDPSDSNYVIWANPAGRYLRADGTWHGESARTGSVANGQSITSSNLTHSHSYTRMELSASPDMYVGDGPLGTKSSITKTSGASGTTQTQPESAVCNLFIKVNN